MLSSVQFDSEKHDISHSERDVFVGLDRVKIYQWFIRKVRNIRAYPVNIAEPPS
jgi:hypothetical protein